MSILSEPAIQAFLARHARRHPPPVAVFDCDGTVIKGDVGETMFYHQIEHFLFRTSPAEVWTDHPLRQEISDLYTELCRAERTELQRHPRFHHFADILLSWYVGQIAEGLVHKACADIVRLFAGFTPGEVRQIAEDSFKNELRSPFSKRTLGERHPPLGIRYIEESVELLRELQRREFTIWAVSGSSKWSVEPVFKRLGVEPERVIGIDLAVENGLLTATAVRPIPIREEKIAALKKHTVRRPALVASDSRNDIPLFLYSSDLKVRINSRKRDTAEFFAAGGIARDDSWVNVDELHILDTLEP